MEETINQVEVISEENIIKKHPIVDITLGIFSALISLFSVGFSFYLASKGTFWFIAIGIYYLVDTTFLIWPLFIKDSYKAMRYQGIFQVIGVVVLMSYLLFMILWNDPNKVMDYSIMSQLCLLLPLLVKAIIALIERLIIKKSYAPLTHAYSNNSLIFVFNYLLIIELVLINHFYPGTTTALFDNLLKEKPLWTYFISIGLNAVSTVFAALLALSTIIRANTKEQLSTTGKIKHTVRWINEKEVSMFIGLIFTLYLAILALIHMKQNFFYIMLFVYYLGTASIRIINYLWHQRIQKKCGDNIIKDNRLSSWILLFDALTYLFFSNILVIGAIFMMIQKANTDTNIYLFLFFIVPMALFRFISSNKSIRKNRRENNTYKLGVSLMGLVNVFFTILEVVAISMHNLPIVWLRYVLIIIAIIGAKIAVIIVAFIFVIHWFRSLILNRRKKERQFKKEKEGM